jgi:pimeloyl-ACP methyl ester carboxylesterase
MEAITRDLLAAGLRQVSPSIPEDAVDEYWKAFGDAARRQAHLDLYRSGDFSKLAPYEGGLAGLGLPALILWGARDRFAPIGGGYRFAKQLPGSEMVVLEEAGHFLMEDEPERVAAEIRSFLEKL